jgi:outer membrane protein OmpA-like peptidoglycan-associated protein
MNMRTIAFLLATVAVASPAAAAEDTVSGFEVRSFHAVGSQSDSGMMVDNARPLGHLSYTAGIGFDWAGKPLVETNGTDETQALIATQGTASLLAGIGLWERLELSMELPVVLVQTTNAPRNPLALRFSDIAEGGGLGDIRVTPKVLLFGPKKAAEPGFAMSFASDVVIPTGSGAKFQGGAFRVAPRLLGDWVFAPGFWIAGNAGVQLLENVVLGNYEQGTALVWGGAARIPLTKWLGLTAEATGTRTFAGDEENALELRRLGLVGLEATFATNWSVKLAGGTRLATGVGNPEFQGGLTVAYTMDYDPDADRDTIMGSLDRCPDEAEDFDGFEDSDGCPERDNDKDGVDDLLDKCEGQLEDFDGFEDSDGCPELDNDKDGFNDDADKCPIAPEDKDGFEDNDGCPEEDNDQDGVIDGLDKCPKDKEDLDGFEDKDGCPEEDNDQDGVLDGADKCADQLETLNGVDDGDGCADEGLFEVNLAQGTVKFATPIRFAGVTATLDEGSTATVAALTALLKQSEGLRLRLVVHTGDAGFEAANLSLSEERSKALAALIATDGLSIDRIATAAYALAATDSDAGTHRIEVRVER